MNESVPVVRHRKGRVREWIQLIAITGSAQVAVQAIGFVCGILVIRLLPVQEYAYYTIANTMLGTMTLLADGGITSGVMSQGGKVWQDKQELGAVVSTGMRLRRQFAVWSLGVSIPILYFLLIKQGASWITTTMICVCLLPTFFSALSGALLEVSVKLHQDIRAVQAIQVASNTLRLMFSALMLFVFPYAALAIVVSGASNIYGNWRLRGVAGKFADQEAREDPKVRREILRIVKRVLPTVIYMSVSSQLTVLVISFCGSSDGVAQVGAIGRLALLMGLIGTSFDLLVTPRFARFDGLLFPLRLLCQIQLAMLAILLPIVLLISIFRNSVLAILGPQYADLELELVLIAIVSAMSLLMHNVNALLRSRGTIPNPVLEVTLSVAWLLILIPLFSIDEVSQVIVLSGLVTSFRYILLIGTACYATWVK